MVKKYLDFISMKMKIIQVVPHLGSGGAERFVVDLSNELAALGHEVTLLTLYDLEGDLGFYKNEISKSVKHISLHKTTGFSEKNLRQVAAIVRNERPDIIHSHIGALQYTIFPQIFMAKGVHTIHNEAHLEVKGWQETLLRKFVFKFNLVKPVTISPESHDSFAAFYGIEAPLINNGRAINGKVLVSDAVRHEIAGYRKSPNTRVVVQLARFQLQKNIPMMARVAARLYSEGYDFSLLFVGSTMDTAVVDEVRSTMPPCAHILGERNNPLEYLKEADAFALSSLYEGMPISLLEALAVGAVPVCTPVGGIPNAVHDGENGFLSKDTSEEAYYLAMKRFLDTGTAALKDMSEKAKESFSPYSMKICAEKYLSLYKELLANK